MEREKEEDHWVLVYAGPLYKMSLKEIADLWLKKEQHWEKARAKSAK